MKKTKRQKQGTPSKGDFSKSEKKFIREFARETALAAREIWQGTQQIPIDDFMMAPEELHEREKPAPVQRDRRGRFVRRA